MEIKRKFRRTQEEFDINALLKLYITLFDVRPLDDLMSHEKTMDYPIHFSKTQ